MRNRLDVSVWLFLIVGFGLMARAPTGQHDIRCRPDDPNVIRFDLDSWWSTRLVGTLGRS